MPSSALIYARACCAPDYILLFISPLSSTLPFALLRLSPAATLFRISLFFLSLSLSLFLFFYALGSLIHPCGPYKRGETLAPFHPTSLPPFAASSSAAPFLVAAVAAAAAAAAVRCRRCRVETRARESVPEIAAITHRTSAAILQSAAPTCRPASCSGNDTHPGRGTARLPVRFRTGGKSESAAPTARTN